MDFPLKQPNLHWGWSYQENCGSHLEQWLWPIGKSWQCGGTPQSLTPARFQMRATRLLRGSLDSWVGRSVKPVWADEWWVRGLYIIRHYPALLSQIHMCELWYIYIYWGLWEFPETNEYNPGWGSESSESANLSDKCHRCSSQVDNHWVCPKKEYTMIYHKMGYTMVYPGPTQQSY